MSDYQDGWDAGFAKGITAIDGFTGHDMAQAREEGYSAGVQRAAEHEGILLNLIAVLHDEHRPYQGCAHDCCRECATCRESWPCETSKELDRAEARLKGLADE